MAVSMNQSRKVNPENDHEAGLIKMNGQCAKNSTSSFINSPTSEHYNQKQHSVTFTIRKLWIYKVSWSTTSILDKALRNLHVSFFQGTWSSIRCRSYYYYHWFFWVWV